MNAIQKARAYLNGDCSQNPQQVVWELLQHIEECALLKPPDARIAELEQQAHDLRVMYGLDQ